MIKTNFYPDDWTGTGTTDLIGTKSVNSLNITDKTIDPMSAYYMGTIDANQNLFYRGTFTLDNGVYKNVRNTTIKPNWGYTYTDDGSSYYPAYPAWNGSKWVSVGSLLYFINSMKYYKCTLANVSYTPYFTLYDFSNEQILGTGERIRYSTTQYTTTKSFNVSDFYDLLYNNADFSVTINGDAYTINLSKWNADGCYFDAENNKRIYITQLVKSSGTNYNCNYYNNHNCWINFTFSIDSPDRLIQSRGCRIFTQYSIPESLTGVTLDNSGNYARSNGAPEYGGGTDKVYSDDETVWNIKPFEITDTAINYCVSSGHTSEYVINSNNDLLKSASNTQITVNKFIDVITWIKLVLGIAPKWSTSKNPDGTTATVNNNSTEYIPQTGIPLFTAADSPKQQIIKTDTYAQLDPQLRPWQKYGYNINDNDFDPDSPTPPGPTPRPDPTDPGDEENGGADIILPIPSGVGGAFGFITQYCMSNSQLEYLGSKLYTEFFNDPDFYQNIVYSFDNTGSINLSDMMSFFVSLRAYPFPLVNLDSWTAAGTDFYIGSGKKPITSFPTQLHTIDQFMDVIDIGSVDVPAYFGDYKDYDMQITLYLPYCGTAELSPGDVIGGTLSGYYLVDFCSGSCTAYVNCTSYDGKVFPVAILPGTLGADVPMTATNAGQVAARLQGDVLNAEQTIVNGLMGMTGGLGSTIAGAMSGNLFGSLSSGMRALQTKYNTIFDLGKQAVNFAGRGAIAAPMLSGGRGFASLGNAATAYIQIRFDVYPEPSNYASSVGIPAAETVRIGDCSGFCQFVNVDVSGITADADDQQAIRSALESGIII